MTHPAFDVAGQLRFELEKGAVSSRADEPLVVLPLSLLAAIPADDAVTAAARRFGISKGREMADQLSGEDLQALSDQIATLLALMGLGSPSIEVHGDALLIRVLAASSDVLSPGAGAVLCGVLGGALESIAGGQPFQVVSLSESTSEAVLFAGNANAAGLMKRAIKGGIGLDEALNALSSSRGEQ